MLTFILVGYICCRAARSRTTCPRTAPGPEDATGVPNGSTESELCSTSSSTPLAPPSLSHASLTHTSPLAPGPALGVVDERVDKSRLRPGDARATGLRASPRPSARVGAARTLAPAHPSLTTTSLRERGSDPPLTKSTPP